MNRLVHLNLVIGAAMKKTGAWSGSTRPPKGRQLAGLVFERRSFRFNNLAVRLTGEERENLIVSLQAVMPVFDRLEETEQNRIKI